MIETISADQLKSCNVANVFTELYKAIILPENRKQNCLYRLIFILRKFCWTLVCNKQSDYRSLLRLGLHACNKVANTGIKK